MAWTVPTAEDFKARFPAFNEVDDATIDIQIAEAQLMVDDRWNSQADFNLGIFLYVAHILTTEGQGGASNDAAGLASYKRIKSGKLELERDTGQAVKPGELAATTYGVRFNELLDRNRYGPVVVGPAAE